MMASTLKNCIGYYEIEKANFARIDDADETYKLPTELSMAVHQGANAAVMAAGQRVIIAAALLCGIAEGLEPVLRLTLGRAAVSVAGDFPPGPR